MASTNSNFISEPDPNLKCSICLDLASQPKQCEDCGKLFCSECIEKNGKKPCPNCRVNNPRYFKDVRSDRDIKAIEVRCTNVERGCPWTGTIGTLDSHVISCEYIEVACAYENLGCEVRMAKKDIKEHETEINTGHFNLMLGIVKSLSKELSTLSDKHKILSEQYQSLLEQHKIQSKQFESLSDQQKTLTEGEAFLFKLSGYSSKKEKSATIYSPSFYTHPGGYKMCINVDANGYEDGTGSNLSVFTEMLEGHYDDQLHWPFLGTVTYELLNQLADDRHYRRVITYNNIINMQVGSNKGYPKFIRNSSLCHDPATNTQYLLDDTLYFRVSVKVDNHKPWLVCTDKINMDSVRAINTSKSLKKEHTYVFRLTGYHIIKERDGKSFSESFYTSVGGYKMCIETHPNGCGSGQSTHISVFVKLLQGSYDANLSWPFLGSVNLTLLNQISDRNHHSKTVEFKTTENGIVDRCLGYSQFISHSALSHDSVKNTQYLKNDTLYFKVFVKDNTHRPWLACTSN